MYKRVRITIVWSDKAVSFRFAKVFYLSRHLRIIESQSRPICNNETWQRMVNNYTRTGNTTVIGPSLSHNNVVYNNLWVTLSHNKWIIDAHVESVLVRLVTIGLGASMPALVGDRWLANFNASCSQPLECDSLMALNPSRSLQETVDGRCAGTTNG